MKSLYTIIACFILYNTVTSQDLITLLQKYQIIQYGSFKLKSGKISPYYIDIRRAISYPEIFVRIKQRLADISNTIQYDALCAVPYGAVPFTSVLADYVSKPLLMLRKEVKTYGMQKMIEGIYKSGD